MSLSESIISIVVQRKETRHRRFREALRAGRPAPVLASLAAGVPLNEADIAEDCRTLDRAAALRQSIVETSIRQAAFVAAQKTLSDSKAAARAKNAKEGRQIWNNDCQTDAKLRDLETQLAGAEAAMQASIAAPAELLALATAQPDLVPAAAVADVVQARDSRVQEAALRERLAHMEKAVQAAKNENAALMENGGGLSYPGVLLLYTQDQLDAPNFWKDRPTLATAALAKATAELDAAKTALDDFLTPPAPALDNDTPDKR